MQDKSKQSVVINTSEYDSKVETILQDKLQYVKVELDPSQHFRPKVEHRQMNILRVMTYRVSKKNARRLIRCKLKTTVFTRIDFIFSESSYFNLKFGIKQSKIG